MLDSGHIFISYKSEQRHLAFQVRDKLQEWGYETWLDVDHLQPGTYWANDIDAALKSCRACVGIMTPASIKSRYVTNEWDMAIMKGKLFLPLVFENTEPHYKYIDIQYVDFTSDRKGDSYLQLRSRLQNHNPASSDKPSDDPYHDYLQQLYDRINKYLSVKLITSLRDEEGEPDPMRLSSARVHGAVDALFEKREEIDPLFAIGGIVDELPEEFNDFSSAFEYYDGRVLLLGEPGSGKTITLLHYARDAVVKRRQDPTTPLPILGIIPSWSPDEHETIMHWLASTYGTPDDVRTLIREGKTLLLLDGLDELRRKSESDVRNYEGLPSDPRLTFIDSLPDNNRILLTCRRKDYQEIGAKARLRGAIKLRSLNQKQVETYLHHQPELRQLVSSDTTLQDWLDTPLYISYFAFAYEQMTEHERQSLLNIQSQGELRDQIFSKYVEQLFQREKRKSAIAFSLDQLHIRLGLIASQDVMGYQYGAPENVIVEADFERAMDLTEIEDFRDTVIQLRLLEEMERGKYRFVHSLLRDYFAYDFASSQHSIELYQFAYRVLARLSDERSLEMLINVVKDDSTSSSAKREAIRAIGYIHAPRATAFLTENIHNQDIEIRKYVVGAIGFHNDASAVPLLKQELKNSNAVVRGRAAKSLGMLKVEEAIDEIALLLDDTAIISFNLQLGEIQVRDAAVEALRRIGTDEALARIPSDYKK